MVWNDAEVERSVGPRGRTTSTQYTAATRALGGAQNTRRRARLLTRRRQTPAHEQIQRGLVSVPHPRSVTPGSQRPRCIIGLRPALPAGRVANALTSSSSSVGMGPSMSPSKKWDAMGAVSCIVGAVAKSGRRRGGGALVAASRRPNRGYNRRRR